MRATALSLAVGAAGAGVFHLIGFPAAFLTGPAVAVTLAGLAGLPVRVPAVLRDACFLMIGINIGAGVTRDLLGAALSWPLSFALLAATLTGGLVVCRRLLTRRFGFDRASALLAATPGHLSYVLSLSADTRTDIERIAVVQSMRVLFLTLLVPVLLTFWDVHGNSPAVAEPRLMAPTALIALGAAGAAVGAIFRRLGVPAAFLLAGMLVSALGQVSALSEGAPPQWLTLSAFVVMGTLIGTRFRGQSRDTLRRSVHAGLTATLVASAFAVLGAVIAAHLMDAPVALLLISFAPGGVEAMAAMAVQIEVDATFVAAHHVMRLVILTFLVPFLMGRG